MEVPHVNTKCWATFPNAKPFLWISVIIIPYKNLHGAPVGYTQMPSLILWYCCWCSCSYFSEFSSQWISSSYDFDPIIIQWNRMRPSSRVFREPDCLNTVLQQKDHLRSVPPCLLGSQMPNKLLLQLTNLMRCLGSPRKVLSSGNVSVPLQI